MPAMLKSVFGASLLLAGTRSAFALGVMCAGCTSTEQSLSESDAAGSTTTSVDATANAPPAASEASTASSSASSATPGASATSASATNVAGTASAGTASAGTASVDTGPESSVPPTAGSAAEVPEPMLADDAGSMGAAGSDPTTAATGSAGGEQAVSALSEYLMLPRAERAELAAQEFAVVPLGLAAATQARELLWADYASYITETREEEFRSKQVTHGELVMRFDYTVFGDAPPEGRSLYLSLHGGGNADPSVNDEQWENQKGLYQPDEGVYLAPRAPTDTWNLWHEAHIDPMFERLIGDLIVFENVNPNRVYVMGYSAGGDGVYQLGPRMADHWAAASMMAGHPNEAQPLSLRNIGFTAHVGALDADYDRNLIAQQWGERMDELQADDPEGYVHFVQLHEGKPHWMDLEDAVAVPWMAEFTRNPVPKKVVWLQDDITHTRFYWLAVPPESALKDALLTATVDGQNIAIDADGTDAAVVRLSDALVDLEQPVSITVGGVEQFNGPVARTIATLSATLEERGDPALVFDAEVKLALP
jgi:hypothetical protein